MKKITAAVLLSMAAAAPALAETPFYIGAQAGDHYIGILGGYQIDKMFSVEGHYYDLDRTAPVGTSASASIIGVAGVAMFPLNLKNVPQLSLFAKVGAERTSVKVSGVSNTTETDLLIGGGAQYDFNKNFSARAGVNFTGNADSLNISGIYRF
jgi:opacity protein-like surface antigen